MSGAAASVFNRFVARLEPDGGRVTAEEVQEVLGALRALLVRELKRRSLWWCSPCLVGILGSRHWAAGPEGASEALEELLVDCYVFTFVERLRGLRARLASQAELSGLVALNVRHFLFERQRRHDPIGYRVYQLLLAAVRRGLAAGELALLGGGSVVRNSTVLLLGRVGGTSRPVAAESLRGSAVGWGDVLVPAFATARGLAATRLEERLRAELRGLAEQGITAVRFKDLLDVAKFEVRQRWSLFFERPEADRATGVTERRQQEQVAELSSCVESGIEAVAERPKTRADLQRLWRFFRAYAEEAETLPAGVLSSRRLSREIAVSRERVPGLLETLQGLVRGCRRGAPEWSAADEPRRVEVRSGPG